jgi:phosphonate transport system substrate-binding protein
METLGAEPIARPVWHGGRSTYHGELFVRKDSGIRSVGDMKGKRMAFVDRATTAGYVFPLAYLRKNGVANIDAFFGEHFFSGSHDAAIDAVLDGRADVGAAKNTIYDRVRRENPRVDEELLILAESPRVPSNSLFVRDSLDDGIKRTLRHILLTMEQDPEGKAVLEEFGALRFVETTHEDCRPVFEMAKEAGIDLKTYQYNTGDVE